ncbi:hypothetical protein [Acinetobacter sp. WY4]|jgi:hypothetical protein|uniref:hypothetical protein n=1 Tax=Acinetobacter sp. WY4 TaxID=2708348 RepID=UPI001BCBEAA8|nr:hypothetical protein [Acinetobacter sp. WY4]
MDKLEFLNSAIQDTQQTIRAIDFKIGALLAGCIVPFPKIREIFEFLTESGFFWQHALAAIIFTMWLVIVFILLAALSAIDNPIKHITDHSNQKGLYFSGGLFKFNLWNLLFRTKNFSTKTVQEYKNEIDDPTLDISQELSYEHLKLIYIRDLKIFRLRYATGLIFILILIGSISFISAPSTKKVDIVHQDSQQLHPKQYLDYLL